MGPLDIQGVKMKLPPNIEDNTRPIKDRRERLNQKFQDVLVEVENKNTMTPEEVARLSRLKGLGQYNEYKKRRGK
jgi:hypothetical protein